MKSQRARAHGNEIKRVSGLCNRQQFFLYHATEERNLIAILFQGLSFLNGGACPLGHNIGIQPLPCNDPLHFFRAPGNRGRSTQYHPGLFHTAFLKLQCESHSARAKSHDWRARPCDRNFEDPAPAAAGEPPSRSHPALSTVSFWGSTPGKTWIFSRGTHLPSWAQPHEPSHQRQPGRGRCRKDARCSRCCCFQRYSGTGSPP